MPGARQRARAEAIAIRLPEGIRVQPPSTSGKLSTIISAVGERYPALILEALE